MGEYHQVKRKHEYKRLKKLLKKEHDISIKSLKEDSSEDMPEPSRSQYSNLISQLMMSQQSAQYKVLSRKITNKRSSSILNQSLELIEMVQQLDDLVQKSHKKPLKFKKKHFEEDLGLKRLLKKTLVKKSLKPTSYRVKTALSTSRIIPKTLLKNPTKANREKFHRHSSFFNNMQTMQSLLEFRRSQLSSTLRKKDL